MALKPSSDHRTICLRVLVKGVVQGVGFRPFVYHLAKKHRLRGQVFNTSSGVVIEIEGLPEEVADFSQELRCRPPRLSRIDSVEEEAVPCRGYKDFCIVSSRGEAAREAIVPADVATCEDCRRDILDPVDRHFGYPFTNCTNCGPRFTIVRDIPYDRSETSMADFTMCKACQQEYHDPENRRFHAQPVACPNCGPGIELVDRLGERLAGAKNWQETAWELLASGAVLAVKGLGGFHLCCDATKREAVQKLRRRKGRDHKPLAVMARDVSTVRRYCHLGDVEEELLTSPSAPIVILERLPCSLLPDALGPNLRTLGVMLPYTPLHFLLLEGGLDLLVMTSGNRSELPLVKDNHQVWPELGGLADYALWHNRNIVNRCDDSVVMVIGGRPVFSRRSRGYVPQGIRVPRSSPKVVLGIGGEMKNTFCLLKQDQAFMSQHMGEMEQVEGELFLRESLSQWERFLAVTPEVIAYDLHPGYATSRLARSLPAAAHMGVQHHHAHLASCLAENGQTDPAIGLILDGTGYGPDGCLWGFEVISGGFISFKRHYHLRYMPLPGGDQAVRHPWRVAASYLQGYLGEEGADIARELWGASRGHEVEVVLGLARSGFNSPLACGCGRLFDAVAALLGLGEDITYEGQLAVEMSELVQPTAEHQPLEPYLYSFDDDQIDVKPLISGLWQDYSQGAAREILARRFHDTLVEILVDAARKVAKETGLNRVVLSGGTWQNRYLAVRMEEELGRAGLTVFSHRHVPANDGGLALGQAMIADWRWGHQCV